MIAGASRAWLPHFAFLALFAYSLHGVGLCCDDFAVVLYQAGDPWFRPLLANPANIPTHWLAFRWIGYQHLFLYDLLKLAWVALAYGMAYRFATLFFPAPRAALFAALFALYPSHDAASFWFSTQYLLLAAAFYLYAFYLAARERVAAAAGMATLGSFVSYGSSPWALGLGLVFALQKQYRRAAALVVPNLVYVGYYVAVTRGFGLGNPRLPETLAPERLLKQFLLQIAGGVDAVLGPGMWLKLWYSLASLTLLSAVVGVALVIVLGSRRSSDDAQARPPAPLWLGATAVALAAFAMFALTPGYPQSAFGMTDRITLYASFPAALLFIHRTRRARAAAALTAVLVFSSLGISDHWRAYADTRDATIEAIRKDADFASGRLDADIVFVVGHDYSRLGPIAHVTFLAEKWISDPVFDIALERRKQFRTVPLASRFVVEADALVDTRDGARYPVGDAILVYDAKARRLQRVRREDLPRFVAGLERPIRHWIQLAGIGWARDLVLRWMPQLGYLWR
jgi:hypothetical protein